MVGRRGGGRGSGLIESLCAQLPTYLMATEDRRTFVHGLATDVPTLERHVVPIEKVVVVVALVYEGAQGNQQFV